MIVTPNREQVIENIKTAVKEDNLNMKVEVDDPKLTSEEKTEIINTYIEKKDKTFHKLNDVIANFLVRFVTAKNFRETEIIGVENVKGIKTGAIITSNHFNQLDSLSVKKFANKMAKKKLYIISQETNFAMTGLFGYIMNHFNLIPISNQTGYMKNDFQSILKEVLDEKDYILIYPEQEMWYNYKKPRTVKPGAYYYASKYNVPIISCFTEIIETDKKCTDDFNEIKYKLHILKPIFPDADKSDKENAAWMSERDYSQKVEAYEKAYGKKLDYTFENSDIAGWQI